MLRVSAVRKSQEFRVPGQEKSIFSKKSGKVRKTDIKVRKSQDFTIFPR